MLTESKRIAYQLFGGMVLLWMCYSAVSLLAALKFLPSELLADVPTYAQLGGAANVLLELTLTSGLLAGGTYVIAAERLDGRIRAEGALGYARQLWGIWVILGAAACFLGLLEGRYGLELPFWLDVGRVILITAWVALVWPSAQTESRPFALVWSAGMLLSAGCGLIGLVSAPNYVADRILRTLAVGLNHQVAYPLGGMALAFWCMRRFSNIHALWAETALYNSAGLVTLAGARLAIAPLYPFGAGGPLLDTTLLLVPLLWAIVAAHSYRALADRNGTQTLAAHWVALGVGLLLVGNGLLGALLASPQIQPYAQGTRLSDLHMSLTLYGTLALLLAANNQASAELRGHNQRVTGLLPFWLVTFGLLIGGGALLVAGGAQVYLERRLSIGYLDVQRELIPLYLIWASGGIAATFGVGIYALGWRARRPQAS